MDNASPNDTLMRELEVKFNEMGIVFHQDGNRIRLVFQAKFGTTTNYSVGVSLTLSILLSQQFWNLCASRPKSIAWPHRYLSTVMRMSI
jgi:hypothetical protein